MAEWQTRTLAVYVAHTAMVDTEKHGGRNPLVDAAMEISLLASDEDDELDEMRGEQTGYVTDEEGREQMSEKSQPRRRNAGGRRKPVSTKSRLPDTIQVDEDGNVVGAGLGTAPELTEQEYGEQASPGSYEALIGLFSERR